MSNILAVFTLVNLKFIGMGLWMTVSISAISIALSLIFGTVLAVLRMYNKGILGKLSIVYIEIFRNTPSLLWILAIRFLVPLPAYSGAILAFTLFTTAMMAEIIRGGLNSIDKGQFEGAASQGFTLLQTLMYIVLPQCFRNVVPALLSQVIAVVKDSSYLWAVAIEELTGRANILMSRYSETSQIFALFAAVAATYFIVNFILSVIVRKQQIKLNN